MATIADPRDIILAPVISEKSYGLIDDNVHLQNTIQLAEALQQADKEFELMIYPKSRHGISGKHYQRLVVEFMRRNLQAPVAVPATILNSPK